VQIRCRNSAPTQDKKPPKTPASWLALTSRQENTHTCMMHMHMHIHASTAQHSWLTGHAAASCRPGLHYQQQARGSGARVGSQPRLENNPQGRSLPTV
jgi:hypothetical protein